MAISTSLAKAGMVIARLAGVDPCCVVGVFALSLV